MTSTWHNPTLTANSILPYIFRRILSSYFAPSLLFLPKRFNRIDHRGSDGLIADRSHRNDQGQQAACEKDGPRNINPIETIRLQPSGHLFRDNMYAEPGRKPLGRLVGAFKTVSTKQINIIRGTPGVPVWQRNYYEHIIRDERSLHRIRKYILNNPSCWVSDRASS